MVRGVAGSEVKMKIAREGEPQPVEFVLLREEIPVRNVTYTGYVEPGIGYVRLERFSRTAADDVRNSIKELQEKGELKSVVLDLRDNPGGLLDIAVSIVSDFVPENSLVVSTRGRRSDSDRKYLSSQSPMIPNVPLAILVDQGSASASEIVAGAIQDLDRGIIVGERTFGKGLVQTISRISETSSVKITTARYYTPSGRCIQEIDYTHRTKDGVFAAMPDSLKKVFRTTHNRRMLEGGGIEPDSVVEEEDEGKAIAELVRKAMFFKFANTYAVTHKTLPETFEVTDGLLTEFENFLKEQKFDYREDSEIKLKELKDIAIKERYDKAFLDDVELLDRMIASEKERKIQRYQKEMKSYLRAEIEGRINGEKAEITSTFPDDRQLKVAVSLLKNARVYNNLLAGRPTSGSEQE
jgi:carboxyl-terminal processing protease